MSARAIHHRLETGEWIPEFRSAYRLAGAQRTWELRAMAGCLAAGNGAVASHRTAASLLGVPGAVRWVEVTVVRPREVKVEGIIAHRTRLLGPGDTADVKGIPVTSAGRTIVDLTGVYGKTKLGPMLDYATANRLVTRADLVARSSGRRHDDVLVELLAERPDTARPMGSDFEAALYRRLREAGLPLPVAQYRILMPDATFVYLSLPPTLTSPTPTSSWSSRRTATSGTPPGKPGSATGRATTSSWHSGGRSCRSPTTLWSGTRPRSYARWGLPWNAAGPAKRKGAPEGAPWLPNRRAVRSSRLPPRR